MHYLQKWEDLFGGKGVKVWAKQPDKKMVKVTSESDKEPEVEEPISEETSGAYDGGPFESFHLTVFEENGSCMMAEAGGEAKVYWLLKTGVCSPLFLSGRPIGLFYNVNDTSLTFGCSNNTCTDCDIEGPM